MCVDVCVWIAASVNVLVYMCVFMWVRVYMVDWEAITGCHQNQTSVPKLIETPVSFSWLA